MVKCCIENCLRNSLENTGYDMRRAGIIQWACSVEHAQECDRLNGLNKSSFGSCFTEDMDKVPEHERDENFFDLGRKHNS